MKQEFYRHALVALLLFLCAAFLRFAWVNWDGGHHLHPDERYLTIVASSISVPERIGDYFNADVSTLNPRNQGEAFYVYGDLPVVLTRLVAEALDQICLHTTVLLCNAVDGGARQWTAYQDIVLVGRFLSAAMALGTLIWLWLLARLLFGREAALLALGLGTVSVLPIQIAHFFIVDGFAAQFAAAAFYFMSRAAQKGRQRDFAWAGISIGLALACRINLLPVVALCALPALTNAGGSCRNQISSWVLHVLITVVFAAAAFRVFMPNAFSGWVQLDPAWIAGIQHAVELGSPMSLYPPGVQWTGRVPWLFPLKDIIFWGMGLALGFSALAGWLVLGRQQVTAFSRYHSKYPPLARMRNLLSQPLAISWVAVTAYFLWVGAWSNPTMRYFLPIYAPLIAFASWFLAQIWRCRGGELALWSRRCIVVCAISTTVLWAVAFTAVYRDAHPRIAATEWLEANLPTGSTIGIETWDDGLPLGSVRGIDRLAFNHYDDDTPEKRDRLLDWLERIDFLSLSSNRVYASVPRQPLRYPMASHYYQFLFSGELGFTPLAEFHSYPRLGGLQFPDQETPAALGLDPDTTESTARRRWEIALPPADEAFSVYDHPRVLIFEKTADFNRHQAAKLLHQFDLDTGLHRFPPGAESQAPTGLMFNDREFASRQAAGTWAELFDRNAMINVYPVLAVMAMYVFVSVFGWLLWPLAFVFLPGLADRGLVMTKSLALLLAGGGAWFLSSTGLIKFKGFSLAAWLAVLVGVSFWVGWHKRARMLAYIRRRRRLAVQGEIVFLIAYLFAVGLRWAYPDLWHPWFGGEKPMDFAFFNAVLKSEQFPPHDPWFAGGYINYFYFGFVLAALPVKLIGIVPEVAYHLASALFYALAACGVFSVAYTLGRRIEHPLAVSWLAVGFVMVLGNLGELQIVVQRVIDAGNAGTTGGLRGLFSTIADGAMRLIRGEADFGYPAYDWFWDATRIIPVQEGEVAPISEFPFFSLLYGDLHAHFMALPLTLLALGVALSWWLRPPARGLNGPNRWPGVLALAVGGVIVGSLRAANAWDFPSYLGLVGLALVIGGLFSAGYGRVGRTALSLGIFLASLTVFSLPFERAFATGYSSVVWWSGSRTPLQSYLLIHGIFLLPISSLLWLQRRALFSSMAETWLSRPAAYISAWYVAGILLVVWIVAAWNLLPVLLVGAPVGVLATAMVLRAGASRLDRAWAMMVLYAVGLTLLVELVSLQGDVGRMNTVFKFYYQVWVLWGICAAVACVRVWSWGTKYRKSLAVWKLASAGLIAGGLTYTTLSVPARIHQRMEGDQRTGLNGALFMATAEYAENGHAFELKWDRDAIRWLQDEVAGTPVIAEGRSEREYMWGNRIAVHTGLPAVLGWRNHELQQRSFLPAAVVELRSRDVDALYRDKDPVEALRIIHRYNVRLIYVGPLEQAYYPQAGLEKFERMQASGKLETVYRNPGVVIYRVVQSSAISEQSR